MLRWRSGLDVAVAQGGGAYYLAMPKVCRVNRQASFPLGNGKGRYS